MKDSYKTFGKESKGQHKDKGSKFYAFGYHVATVEEAKSHIENLRKRYHDARHHCFAYHIGHDNITYRINDDGEPSGTAGRSIYGRIKAHELSNIVIVVVRYFGGTLLGTSGLIKAYRSAAESCIMNAKIIECTIDSFFEIHFQYEQINKVMRLVKNESLKIINQVFDTNCKMELSVRQAKYGKVTKQFLEIENLKLVVP
ncbi:IMPACT family member YigZ [subsurface metagenome]